MGAIEGYNRSLNYSSGIYNSSAGLYRKREKKMEATI